MKKEPGFREELYMLIRKYKSEDQYSMDKIYQKHIERCLQTLDNTINSMNKIQGVKLRIERDEIRQQSPHDKFIGVQRTTRLTEAGCSVRLLNTLMQRFEDHISNYKVQDLTNYSENDYLKIRNAGKSTINELKALLAHAGLNLNESHKGLDPNKYSNL